MNKFSVDLKIDSKDGITLDRSESTWNSVLLISFTEPTRTVTRPLSIITVTLENPHGIWVGYYGTPPLRKLEGEQAFEVGETIEKSIDLFLELGQDDPEEVKTFPSGKAHLLVKGLIWVIGERPVKFQVLKEVIVV